MEARTIRRIGSTLAFVAFFLCMPLRGGVPGELSASMRAMDFLEAEIPELHAEIQVILRQMPEMSEAVNETVTDIHENFLRFSEMNHELANIFLSIKKREFQNQILAEKIQTLTDPEKRRLEFKRLADHMDVTFDLHLRLVSGELAWLEREVEGLKELVASEKEHKRRYLREDLESLLLKNDPLLRISINGLGEKQTKEQQVDLKKLIEDLPLPKSEKQ